MTVLITEEKAGISSVGAVSAVQTIPTGLSRTVCETRNCSTAASGLRPDMTSRRGTATWCLRGQKPVAPFVCVHKTQQLTYRIHFR